MGFSLFSSSAEVPYSCFLYFRSCLDSQLKKEKKELLFLFFLTSSPSPSHLKLFKVQLGRRMHVCRIKESVETIKRFGMWKCSEGATVCICVAPERLPHAGEASGKGSRQSDCTPGHKTPTMHCVLPLTPLRHREKAIKAFIGFALKICSRQLKIITNQIKIEVAQTTIRPGHRLDLCRCKRAPNDG